MNDSSSSLPPQSEDFTKSTVSKNISSNSEHIKLPTIDISNQLLQIKIFAEKISSFIDTIVKLDMKRFALQNFHQPLLNTSNIFNDNYPYTASFIRNHNTLLIGSTSCLLVYPSWRCKFFIDYGNIENILFIILIDVGLKTSLTFGLFGVLYWKSFEALVNYKFTTKLGFDDTSKVATS